jgi:hypothetical protein
MADVKVPPMLHKMSVSAQKAWYKKNKMEYPGAGGKEGRSAAQAKKDVGEINKKKAREAAIARAAASKKNKELVSSSERVREMGRRRRESGEGLGGGLETNRDILSYVRAGGTIKAGRLGENLEEGRMKDIDTERKETARLAAQEKEPPFTPDKNPVRRGRGGPMSQAKWLAKQAMMKKRKEMGMKEEAIVEVAEEPKHGDAGEYDYEGDMAKSQLRSIMTNAKRMHDMLEDNTNLPEWVQSKITLAEDYVLTATNYMESEMNEEFEQVDEKINLEKAKMGDVIKDFQKSDAPQFKGKSMEKRREMAIAAKLGAEREVKEDVEAVEEKYMGFKAVMASAKKGGARDPAAVAAAIGRKKYGKEKFQAAAAAGKKMSEAALDPVGKEDKDVDNDGDSDKTDVYLSKRRKAISSAIRKKVADKMGK